MSSKYFLQVTRVEGVLWEGSSFGSSVPKLYVKVKLGNTLKQTQAIRDIGAVWDEVLTFPDIDTTTKFSVELMHDSTFGQRKDVCLGFIDIEFEELSNQCANGPTSLLLKAPPYKNYGNPSLVVSLLDTPSRLLHVEGRVTATVQAVQHLEISDKVSNVLGISEQLSSGGNVSDCLTDLLQYVNDLVTFMDKLSGLHPCLAAVWGLTSALFKAVLHQIETDQKLVKLVYVMKDTYNFATRLQSVQDKAFKLKQKTEELIQETINCCRFVLRLTNHNFPVRLFQNSRSKIDNYIKRFSDLKKLVDSEIGLLTGLATTEISQKVDGISEKVDGMSKKLGGIAEKNSLKHLKDILKPLDMNEFNRKQCLPNTRVEILDQIMHWIFSDTDQSILWLRGVAGSGKSTIATTIREACSNMMCLGASFFFTRDETDGKRLSGIFRTISYQLSLFDFAIAKNLQESIDKYGGISDATAETQFNRLLLEPLAAAEDAVQGPVVIIIEALDESGSSASRERLMRILKRELGKVPNNFRFLITGRPEADICTALSNRPESVYELDLNSESDNNLRDVHRYIDHEMNLVFEDSGREKPSDWVTKMWQLAKASEGLFIWASTAVKMVKDNIIDPAEELGNIVKDSHLLKGLDQLYESILRNSGVFLNPASTAHFAQVLGLVILSKSPVSDNTIDAILDFPQGVSSRFMLSKLRSVLSYEPGTPIRVFHKSFADYLSSNPALSNSPDSLSGVCFIDISSQKSFVAMRCFDIMKNKLRFNMCNLETSSMLNKDVLDIEERVKVNIPTQLGYACLHWAQHLRDVPNQVDSPITDKLMERLKFFAYDNLLYWLEVISLLGKLEVTYSDVSSSDSSSVFDDTASREVSDRSVQYDLHDDSDEDEDTWPSPRSASSQQFGFTEPYSDFSSRFDQTASRILTDGATWSDMHDTDVSSFLRDAINILSAFAESVAESTPHIYVSMIPHMIGKSKVADHYSQRTSSVVRVDRTRTKRGSLQLKVLVGHEDSVSSVSISPDGKYAASASEDHTIRIWDIESGCLKCRPFKGHQDTVSSVAFSPDGQCIVSGSWDTTVRVWDIKSGELVSRPSGGHTGAVISVAFSPLGTLIASGSEDKTIRVWDVKGSSAVRVIEGHTDTIHTVAFSHDGKRIVSGSSDKTIRVWDLETGQASGEPFMGHEGRIRSVSVSPDGKHVVSGSWDDTVRVWDIECGKVVFGPIHQAGWIMSVAFSPDGKRIATGLYNDQIVISDMESGKAVCSPLIGHTDTVNAVAFSVDGKYIISASDDMTVRVWDASADKVDPVSYVYHTDWILSVACSPDGSHVASGSKDRTIGLWDTTTCAPVCAPFVGHTDEVSSVAFSHDGRRIVSGSYDKTVIIWHVDKRKIGVGPLLEHNGAVYSVDFSPDGTRVASGAADKAIIIWDAANGEVYSRFGEVHKDRVGAVRFSPDGKLIASASADNDVILWNAETGDIAFGPYTTQKSFWYPYAPLSFSPDGKHIASRSGNDDIIVRDVKSGNIVCGPLKGNGRLVYCISFSSDGRHIASCTRNSDSGEVMIWNASSGMDIPRSYAGHSGHIACVTFSPDGSRLISCSYDETIRTWEVPSQDDPVASTAIGTDVTKKDEQFFMDWSLSDNGWILSPKGERLLWIPEDIRDSILPAGCTSVFNRESSTKLDFKDAALSQYWQDCFDPTKIIPYPEAKATSAKPEIETTPTDPGLETNTTATNLETDRTMTDPAIQTAVTDSSQNIREGRELKFLHQLVDLLALFIFAGVDLFHYLISFVKR